MIIWLYLSYVQFYCIWMISSIIDKRLYFTLFDSASTSWVFIIT